MKIGSYYQRKIMLTRRQNKLERRSHDDMGSSLTYCMMGRIQSSTRSQSHAPSDNLRVSLMQGIFPAPPKKIENALIFEICSHALMLNQKIYIYTEQAFLPFYQILWLKHPPCSNKVAVKMKLQEGDHYITLNHVR